MLNRPHVIRHVKQQASRQEGAVREDTRLFPGLPPPRLHGSTRGTAHAITVSRKSPLGRLRLQAIGTGLVLILEGPISHPAWLPLPTRAPEPRSAPGQEIRPCHTNPGHSLSHHPSGHRPTITLSSVCPQRARTWPSGLKAGALGLGKHLACVKHANAGQVNALSSGLWSRMRTALNWNRTCEIPVSL